MLYFDRIDVSGGIDIFKIKGLSFKLMSAMNAMIC